MDESDKVNGKGKKNDKRESSISLPGDSDVPEPLGFRRNILLSDEVDQFILDYHRNFLPGISFILWAIFLVSQ